jgi:methylmalonyl-CoA/ethylmalonyl-CoA epimerase
VRVSAVRKNLQGENMKVLKVDHIGIAVKSIDAAKQLYSELLGLSHAGSETVVEQKVTTAFFPVGDTEVELLESTSLDGLIAKYLEKKGEGIHHIAFRVENMEEALAELKAKGIQLIDEKPRRGAGGAKIAFLHPKSTFGMLIELCEKK